MKRFPQALVNVDADKEQKLVFLRSEKIKKILDDAKAELGSNGRIVARPSGTESLVRIMVECDTDPEKIANETAEKIRAVLAEA